MDSTLYPDLDSIFDYTLCSLFCMAARTIVTQSMAQNPPTSASTGHDSEEEVASSISTGRAALDDTRLAPSSSTFCSPNPSTLAPSLPPFCNEPSVSSNLQGTGGGSGDPHGDPDDDGDPPPDPPSDPLDNSDPPPASHPPSDSEYVSQFAMTWLRPHNHTKPTKTLRKGSGADATENGTAAVLLRARRFPSINLGRSGDGLVL